MAGWLPASVAGAEPSPGDAVHVRWAGENVRAEVVALTPTGWIKVRFRQSGQVLTPVLPPDEVFADGKELAAAEDDKEKQLLELLRTNSDGKNVSSEAVRPWHAPGKAGRKFGPVLFQGRVKAYRAGSHFILFEAKDGKEHLLRIEQIANADRKQVFDLLRKPPPAKKVDGKKAGKRT